MPKIEIISQKIDNQLYAAVLENRNLIDLYVDSKDFNPCWGALYLAKVEKLDKNLDGAFVNLGGNQMGFLPAKHVHKKNIETKNDSITQLLECGDMIIVQVKSEGKAQTEHEEQKLPRVTMKLFISGRFLMFSPTANKVTISRQITNKDIFKAANTLKSTGGWIIRTEANDISVDQLLNEAEYLKAVWKSIFEMRSNNSQSPRLLQHGLSALNRALLDYTKHGIERIEIAEDCYTQMFKNWCENYFSTVLDTIKIIEPHKIDLFETHDIYGYIEDALSPLIPLEGGGSLIIESTHALTVIDVNRGTAKTVTELNKQAAAKVARQMRLRNISGVILVDFVNQSLKSSRYALIEALETALKFDHSSTRVHGFTRLGIMEVTRTRKTAPLAEKRVNLD